MKNIAKSCCCALAVMAAVFGMAAAPRATGKASFKSEIALLPGEVWWGGGGGDGQNQPYGLKDSRRINLRRNGATASPLLVSSAGRYVWSEKPFEYQFAKGVLRLDSRVERIEPVVAGKTLKDAYLAAAKAHFRFDGKTPPDIFFTLPQWNNWIEIFLNGMGQKAADDYTAELAKSGFPCGIYMMDGGWMISQGTYEFYPRDFPDPKGLFDRIRSHGWTPLIWTANFVSPDSREYKKLRYHRKPDGLDYLIHVDRPGSHDAAVFRWWSGISAVYDLTNPKANAYYAQTLRDFAAKFGIAGYKFDAGGAHYFESGCRMFDPKAEGVDYTRLYAEFAAREFPYHEIRVSWKCGGLPIVTRLNDRAHAWTGGSAQDTVIPQIIAAGMLGCPYVLGDMVGGGLDHTFLGRKVDEKLFVRSAAMQSLLPMMQFSAAPWRHLSPEGVRLCRVFADLHVAFGPYIMETARHAAKTGEPIVRAMEYEFPHQGFNRPMQQFMLGDRWLVAPVTTPDDAKTVELPAGKWRDDLGEEHLGPKTLNLKDVPLDRLPRYERIEFRCQDKVPTMGAASAEVWYVPGWNRTTETNGLAYTSCTNVFKGKVCAFWGWDGDRSWSTSAANADVAAKRLADEIASTNAAFRSELVIVGHSLGGRIVARTLAELSRQGVKVAQGIMLAPAIPMNDPDVALMGGGCVRPAIVVVNPKDSVLKYCYDMVGGEGGPALGRNGSPTALANVVEYAVPKTITNETKIDAAWGRSEAVKRVCNHLAAFYFTELRRILDGKPSKSAQVRVPQGRINLEWKVIDAGVWWDVLDTCGGWKLERNIVTGHCRIISPERKRAAWGPESQMRASFSKIRAQLSPNR